MAKTIFFIPVLFFFFLLAGGASARLSDGVPSVPPSSIEASLKLDSLFQVLSAKRGFNGNVLISQNGEIVYENSFGYADLKAKTPLTMESSFQIASLTKQFTAMAVMMLYDEGKLNFQDTVQRFFPKFPYKNITIHQLLTHRSGLPEYMNFARLYWKDRKRWMDNQDVMDMLVRYHPGRVFLPDRNYKYNNTGYVVLACIVEKVSGVPFSTFVEERIFKELGMTHTFFVTSSPGSTAQFTTKGHTKTKRKAEEDYLSGVVGDKGIYSTVEDMFKWDQALYTEHLVKKETLEEAFTAVSYDRWHRTSYGYGWRIENLDDGTKIVYHAGWWRGYNSLFVRRLNDKTAIIVLSNRVNWSFRNVDRLMDILDSSRHAATSAGGG